MSLTLEEVAQQFAQWRSSKKPKEPIPSELWDKVTQIAQQYSVSKITSRLGINYTQYSDNVPHRLDKANVGSTDPITFVNVPPSSLPSIEKPIVLDFVRGDGALAKCHCVDVDMMRDTLSWFLKGG